MAFLTALPINCNAPGRVSKPRPLNPLEASVGFASLANVNTASTNRDCCRFAFTASPDVPTRPYRVSTGRINEKEGVDYVNSEFDSGPQYR